MQIKVKVLDKLTEHPILFPQFELRNADDSTAVNAYVAGMNDSYLLTIPRKKATYYLTVKSPIADNVWSDDDKARVEKQGHFEPQSILVDVPANYESEEPLAIDDIYLSRFKPKVLQEITVTTSKVMFYHKGDTLIYNADAFLFAEGSSLDAIIEQLPGVELKQDGRILVNGKFVQALLLNGKDLFNGNNQLMLENLPAYTVKDIAVYNKAGRESQLMGHNTGDTQYVMDVRLKRQYRTGIVANAEVGYGTEDRYLARLFGMLFSDNVSFTVYGSVNNLSDASKPGKSDGSWSRDKMGTGVQTRQLGGLTYQSQGQANKWEVNGGVDVVNTDIDSWTYSTTQTYLQGGDNHSYQWSNSPNSKFEVNTSHSLSRFLTERIDTWVKPELKYSRSSGVQDIVSATFDRDLGDSISADIMERVLDTGTDLSEALINRNLQHSASRTEQFSAMVNTGIFIKTKSTGQTNNLRLGVDIGYSSKSSDKYRPMHKSPWMGSAKNHAASVQV